MPDSEAYIAVASEAYELTVLRAVLAGKNTGEVMVVRKKERAED